MSTPDPAAPAPDDLRAHWRGLLPVERSAAIDAWLATQSEATVEALLSAADADAGGGLLRDAVRSTARPTGYVSEAPGSRFATAADLGSGGMAVVHAVHDRVLDREVALKVLRPRAADEGLERYQLREAAFRREAAITAALEHPGIVPVHDAGRFDGQPAFAMKRIAGRTLATVLAEGVTPPMDLMPVLTRIAEAIGYAHERGVVHRDLTPANVLIGAFGAVHVLDWGVAEHRGQGGTCAGTPAWMAPEQARGEAADPRMDVFALGGLLLAVWCGSGPRPDPARPELVDCSALATHPVPRGLAALIRRCLAVDARQRPAHGGEVAEELQRWRDQGLTLAQEAGWWELAWLRLRRPSRARTTLMATLVILVGAGCGWWWSGLQERHEAQARLAAIADGVALDRPEAVALALERVRSLRRRLPDLAEAAHLETRLATALDLALAREREAALRRRLEELLVRTRRLGPWADQVGDWRAALAALGLTLESRGVECDVRLLRGSPLATTLAQALAFLWRSQREGGEDVAARDTALLLAAAGPTAGWQALGRQLEKTVFRAHDPVFCTCADSDQALTDPGSAAAALALFGPERRLEDYAHQRLLAAPGDFWPLVAAARAALARHDDQAAERLALVASGAEPDSLIPSLLLAYVHLVRGDGPALTAAVGRGLAKDAGNMELRALQVVALLRSGDRNGAERQLALIPAGHLRYHLAHRVGHPMELTVDALVAGGLTIPAAAPDLGPLSPHHH